MHDFMTNLQSAIPLAQVPQSKADKDVSELPVKAKTALLEKANAQAPPPQPGAALLSFSVLVLHPIFHMQWTKQELACVAHSDTVSNLCFACTLASAT